MNQLRHGFGRKVVVVWAAVLMLGAPAPVLGVAATNPANSGQGLEISPPVVELQADGGNFIDDQKTEAGHSAVFIVYDDVSVHPQIFVLW